MTLRSSTLRSAGRLTCQRAYSSAPARPSRPPTRFPTLHNPVRSASNPKIQLPKGQLVYNPSPAAPSPYYTPAVFLPKGVERVSNSTDPRNNEFPIAYMPALNPDKACKDKQYNLTEKDLIEIHQLRTSDPSKWTRKALAAKFNCSEFMIGVASKPDPSYAAHMADTLAQIKDQWGPRTLRARNDRLRRRKLWVADAN